MEIKINRLTIYDFVFALNSGNTGPYYIIFPEKNKKMQNHLPPVTGNRFNIHIVRWLSWLEINFIYILSATNLSYLPPSGNQLIF